ncbi:STAS/SEC14 domain-containing protein [Patescibacteria group bacterium]|nr:STAS/SEC14 domain-containing protein [Patescibacteria group bacterium]
MLSDNELQKTFNLKTEESKIVVLTFTKFLSEEDSDQQADLVVSLTEGVFNKNPKDQYDLLIDLTPLEILPSFITKKSREKYEAFGRNKQLRKVAIVGANLFYKVATNFLMTASKRSNMRWFSNKKEALDWLKPN